ncbi:PrgI family protein [Christensenellaceae bacterium OttesenSCG-928-L17]|nr:PrgI family protein [Christensenellaceae bacterium OttesenSCG-928-L17]
MREYSESMFLGLSLRQCVFSLLAMLVAVGLFFAVRNVVGEMQIAWVCTLGAMPFAALGFVKYQGMTAEQFLLAFIRTELLLPERLVFEGENIYADILLPAMEQQQKARKKHTKKNKKGAMPNENI